MCQMTVSAPLVQGRRLIIVVYSSDVLFLGARNTSYPTAGPVASVSLSNVTSSDAPGRIQLVTSKVGLVGYVLFLATL